MKIIMMGTGQYALPTLQALYTTPHEIVALFTRPERSPRHRRPPAGPALPQLAQAHGTPVYDPPDVNAPKVQQILRNLAPDLLVVCDYGQRLAGETLSLARWGGFNLHASLLPKYRGAAPVNWALYHGETHTGNTVIHMTPQIDGGPCVAQQPVAIDPEETAVQLEARLATAGASLVLTAIDQLQADALEEVPQDPHEVTRAPKLKKTDGRVHWDRSAQQIHNQVRAFQPWPKTFTSWLRPGRPPLRLILDRVRVGVAPSQQPPGTVIAAGPSELAVATGEGVLEILHLQPAGKRSMPADQFLRGYPVQVGDRFGDSAAC